MLNQEAPPVDHVYAEPARVKQVDSWISSQLSGSNLDPGVVSRIKQETARKEAFLKGPIESSQFTASFQQQSVKSKSDDRFLFLLHLLEHGTLRTMR